MLDKNNFIQFLISQGALKFGRFMTKSGRNSPYFINIGEFNTGEAIAKLGTYYANHIVSLMRKGRIPKDVNKLFGPAYKGVPLCVSAAALLSLKFNVNLAWVFNRKEAKDHGEGGSFIGANPENADKILILDDVITAGTALREVLPIITGAADVKIAGLIVAVDRMEKGQSDISAASGIKKDLSIPVFPIITVLDVISYLKRLKNTDEDSVLIGRMEEYLKAYGPMSIDGSVQEYMRAVKKCIVFITSQKRRNPFVHGLPQGILHVLSVKLGSCVLKGPLSYCLRDLCPFSPFITSVLLSLCGCNLCPIITYTIIFA